MKNTSWSLVPFQDGENATPIRPPSPSVVWLFGTVPTCVLPLPFLLILNTLNVSRSVTSPNVPSGDHDRSHGMDQPLDTWAGVPGLLPPPQAAVVKAVAALLGDALAAASFATMCTV